MNLFVTVEAFYLFSCRSLTHPVWHMGVFTNRWLLVGVAAQAAGQAALTYLPAMNALFQTAPIGWEAWLRILIVAAIAQRFRLTLVPGQQIRPTPYVTLRPEPGIRVRLERR